jgi:hypothetical protein
MGAFGEGTANWAVSSEPKAEFADDSQNPGERLRAWKSKVASMGETAWKKGSVHCCLRMRVY